jgi:AraC family transcriptional regulator, positive regulator of tynA and feaB
MKERISNCVKIDDDAPEKVLFGVLELQSFNRYGLWKDFVHDNFPWLEHRLLSRDSFRATVEAFQLADCSLSVIGASASEVTRTRHLAEASEEGFVKVLWQISGTLGIQQDQHQCRIEPGEVTACDTARPYRITLSEGATFVVLMCPYTWVSDWSAVGAEICATRLADSFTARAAIGSVLATVGTQAVAGPSDHDAAIQSMKWMLSSALARSCARISTEESDSDERFFRAKRLIQEQISNPGLDADAIAASLCMSRRSLYLMFEKHQQTPSAMIREARLDKAADVLRSPHVNIRKITDVAFDFGFSDYATFSRLFKQRFGTTPTEFRSTRKVIALRLAERVC